MGTKLQASDLMHCRLPGRTSYGDRTRRKRCKGTGHKRFKNPPGQAITIRSSVRVINFLLVFQSENKILDELKEGSLQNVYFR